MFDKEKVLDLISKFEISKFDEIYVDLINDSEPYVDFSLPNNKKLFKQLFALIFTDDVKINFEKKYIVKMIKNIVMDSFDLSFSDLKKKLDDFEKDLDDKINRDYSFLIPLDNIKIENKICLGNVEIGNYDDFIDEVKLNFSSYDYTPKFICTNNYKNVVFAKVNGKGVPKFQINDKYNEVRIILSILNLFKKTSESPIVINNELIMSRMYYFAYSNGGYGFEMTYLNDKRFKYAISQERFENFKNQINILVDIFNKDNLSDIEKRIIKSIFFYNEANLCYLGNFEDFYSFNESEIDNLKYSILSKSFIFLFTSLETLLVNSNMTISKKLSSRASRLIWDDLNSRELLKEEIKELYDKRSRLIHNADNYINYSDVKKLNSIVASCIYQLVYSYKFKNLESDEDLSNFFDDINKNNNYLEDLKKFIKKLD